ncbi:MAG: hypothetical protein HN948_03955 [Clostridia bacterium]|jgi:L-arabinose isomerase|nr:hypothetical protein [Clostridia bacterium]MBT7122148.1 hypothetical protein [Clostridia bacterium]
MLRNKRVGYVCFGEVNTPHEHLKMKHKEGLSFLESIDDMDVLDAGLVLDDPEYKTAGEAIEKLQGYDMDCLFVCVAGWIPTHAVIKVTDVFANTPMILFGMCGWVEDGRIFTTAAQAGTSGIRPAFEAMGYQFKFIYCVMGEPMPKQKVQDYINACYAMSMLRHARVGTMGYRDMLLYGTQFEGNSMRKQIGVEVEPFEMLEMVQNVDTLDNKDIAQGVAYIKENWKFEAPCDDDVLEDGVKYALALKKKIDERGYEAITLNDVDGMKKLLGFPPAMVFMLLEHYCGVQTVPENDVMGNVTQLMLKYITGDTIPYFEYYEFFSGSMLAGVPDYIPAAATDGDIKVLPAAFGKLSMSLLNVSSPKTGEVTCARLVYKEDGYYMHLYEGNAKKAASWAEYGWTDPIPQLPSLEIEPTSCTVEEFARKVSSQHVLVAYGNHTEALVDLCGLLGIEVI